MAPDITTRSKSSNWICWYSLHTMATEFVSRNISAGWTTRYRLHFEHLHFDTETVSQIYSHQLSLVKSHGCELLMPSKLSWYCDQGCHDLHSVMSCSTEFEILCQDSNWWACYQLHSIRTQVYASFNIAFCSKVTRIERDPSSCTRRQPYEMSLSLARHHRPAHLLLA